MPLGLLPSFKNERKTIKQIINSIDNIYGMLNVEYKKHHYNRSVTALTASTTIIDLSDIDRGTGGGTVGTDGEAGSRDGDTILLKNLTVRGTFFTGSTSPAVVKVSLVRDYNNDIAAGNPPVYDEIYDASVDTINRLRNLEGTRRYKVLQSKLIRLQGSATDDAAENVMFQFNRKFNSHIYYHDAVGDDTTGASTGKLYLAITTNLGAQWPLLGFQSRLTFIDN